MMTEQDIAENSTEIEKGRLDTLKAALKSLSPPEWKLTETLLIAASVPYTYALVYGLSVGYADYFQIPTSLISVSIFSATGIFILLFALLSAFALLQELITSFLPARVTGGQVGSALIALGAAGMFAFLYSWLTALAIVTGFIIFAILYHVAPRGPNKSIARVHKATDAELLHGHVVDHFARGMKDTLLRKLAIHVDTVSFQVISIAIALLVASARAGYILASYGTVFSVDAVDTSLVNVAEYPDLLVFAKQVGPRQLSADFVFLSKEELGKGKRLIVRKFPHGFKPSDAKPEAPANAP